MAVSSNAGLWTVTSTRVLMAGWLLTCVGTDAGIPPRSALGDTNLQTFAVKGVIQQLTPDGHGLVIQHEAIPGYMDAMTMPFKVRGTNELSGRQSGEVISFQLHVTETESWIDQIRRIDKVYTGEPPGHKTAEAATPARPRHPLMDFRFTNELGQAVSLADFRGQALAITFFFTRCPIPDYCPRLSKNFEEASAKLSSMPNSPTNWHMLSVTFDPDFDTPAVLKAYGQRYGYDPRHWSFLTGPSDKIKELASQSNVSFDRNGVFINHSFRTLIIDAAGQLQMVFPTSGNLSEAIASEVLKAAAVTNRPS